MNKFSEIVASIEARTRGPSGFELSPRGERITLAVYGDTDLNMDERTSSSADTGTPTVGLNPRDRKIVRLCLAVMGALAVGSWIGVASSPYLVNNYPLLLVAISARSRHIILVTPLVAAPMLLLVACLRNLVFTALSFFLGRSLGEPGLVWLEQRSKGFGRFVRWLERFFLRWSYLAVFVFPFGTMAFVAGVARMRPLRFFAVAIPGITFRLSLYILLGDSMRGPIMNFLELVRAHQVSVTIAVVLSMAMYQLYKHKWRDRESA